MKDKSVLLSRLIAHRGVHSIFLENTMDAFKMAVYKGYSIELDVQLSSDGEIVVFHDFTLKRLFGENKAIRDIDLLSLRKYKVCTLSEVLDFVCGRVFVLIEVKVFSRLLLQKLVNLLDSYKGCFAVCSFHPLCVLYFRLRRPNYLRGLFAVSSFMFFLKPDFVGIPLFMLRSDKVQKLRNYYVVLGYTVRSEGEYLKYFSLADNFICDIKKQETVPLRTVSQKE